MDDYWKNANRKRYIAVLWESYGRLIGFHPSWISGDDEMVGLDNTGDSALVDSQ